MDSIQRKSNHNRNIEKILLILVILISLVNINIHSARSAVNLLYFIGIPRDGSVLLEWRTGGEINLAGFNLYRSVNQPNNFTRINQNTIAASGDPLLGAYYEYNDQQLTNGTVYYYRLEFVKSDQTTELYGPLQVTPGSNATGEAPLTPGTPTGQTPTVQNTPTSSVSTQTPTLASIVPTSTSISTQVLETPAPTLPNQETVIITPTPLSTEILTETITPIQEVDLRATGTAIAIALATDAAKVTPEVTTEDSFQYSTQDLIRIGLLFLVATVWILLGIWLYVYLSKLNTR